MMITLQCRSPQIKQKLCELTTNWHFMFHHCHSVAFVSSGSWSYATFICSDFQSILPLLTWWPDSSTGLSHSRGRPLTSESRDKWRSDNPGTRGRPQSPVDRRSLHLVMQHGVSQPQITVFCIIYSYLHFWKYLHTTRWQQRYLMSLRHIHHGSRM